MQRQGFLQALFETARLSPAVVTPSAIIIWSEAKVLPSRRRVKSASSSWASASANRTHRGTDHVGEAREDVRFETIRLRELAGRFRRVPHLTQIAHHDGHHRRGERRYATQLGTSGGFEHDQRQRQRSQSFDQRAHPAFIVGDGEALQPAQYTLDQLRVRDSDADEHGNLHDAGDRRPRPFL